MMPQLDLEAINVTRVDDELVIRWREDFDTGTLSIGPQLDKLDEVHHIQGQNHELRLNAPDYRVFVKLETDTTRLISAERVIDHPEMPNVRDIGGYLTESGKRVRWGLIYRGTRLQDNASINALNLKQICDLRSKDEIEESPDAIQPGMDYIHLDAEIKENRLKQLWLLLTNRNNLDKMLDRIYQKTLVDDNPQIYRAIFDLMAAPDNLPMYIHCSLGKDRTGVAIALILAALGVPDEWIIADYSASNAHETFFHEASQNLLQQLRFALIRAEAAEPLMIASPERMQRVLNHIRATYGDIDRYLIDHAQISESTLHQVRENLLESTS